MGSLTYGTNTRVSIDDRPLVHLQVVIGNKLRRHEGFYFSWREDPTIGDGRRSIWVHPQSDLDFKYFGHRTPTLNRAWLEALAEVANSPSGLYVVPEPADVGEGDPV